MSDNILADFMLGATSMQQQHNKGTTGSGEFAKILAVCKRLLLPTPNRGHIAPMFRQTLIKRNLGVGTRFL